MKSSNFRLKLFIVIIASTLFTLLVCLTVLGDWEKEEITLPKPNLKGTLSVEEAIKARRCIRGFQTTPLAIEQLSQILWAAQGITQDGGFMRAAPSAGALYPLELFALIGKDGITGLNAGVYHYIPTSHSIKVSLTKDLREQIMTAALKQKFIAEAPLVIVITADYNRTAKKYGERTPRYVHIEVGHVGENIMLQAISLDLTSAIVGAFNDEQITAILQLPPELKPLLLIPVGYKK